MISDYVDEIQYLRKEVSELKKKLNDSQEEVFALGHEGERMEHWIIELEKQLAILKNDSTMMVELNDRDRRLAERTNELAQLRSKIRCALDGDRIREGLEKT